MDQIDALDADVSALERTLGDASEVARAFDGQLRGVQQSLSETTRDLGNLERGFSGGLRRAFDGVFLDGMKLSDALGVVAKSMAAVNPVTTHLGGMLAQGVNAAVTGMMPFADGASFSQGRVMPFASGGVVHVTMNIKTPDAQSFQRSESQIASQMSRLMGRAQRNK